MMTKKFSLRNLILILFFSHFICPCFGEETPWTVSALKFDYAKGIAVDGVSASFSELYPQLILDKLGTSLNRVISQDEKLQRAIYDSRKERLSLYLQLASEYRKRDALILENYTEKELKRKIDEENAKLRDLQAKIDENIRNLKDTENKLTNETHNNSFMVTENHVNNEGSKFASMLKNMFSTETNGLVVEKVNIKKDAKNEPILFTPSETIKNFDFTHPLYEKEVLGSKINMLLSGTITKYGDYLLVSVDAYLYPGCQKIGTVSEVGSLDEVDWITSSIAMQLTPVISNSKPVILNIDFGEQKDVLLYIDEKLQDSTKTQIIIESGVHTLLFTKQGYKSAGTTYFFEGNRFYKIDVKLESQENKTIYFNLNTPFEGELYANGSITEKYMNKKSSIRINENSVLGQFIMEDGTTAPFYMPENFLAKSDYFNVKVKPLDRDEYIDARRRWMYGTYSGLVVSLIPYFVTLGNSEEYTKLANRTGLKSDRDAAFGWTVANWISGGLSIAAGVFFVYELLRYFYAADSVIPVKPKIVQPFEIIPVSVVSEDTENENNSELKSENIIIEGAAE